MGTPLAVQTNKASGGLCPHGLPPGACPICSGGMGTSSAKKADFSAKPGEMSWNECAAIGAMLRAQKLRTQQNEQAYQNRLFAKPAVVLFNKVLIPAINFIKNMPANVMNFTGKFFNKVFDIQDKLTAMFGELKASIEKKVSDKLQEAKKKIISLFGIYEPKEVEEEKKVETSKRTFEARTFLHDVYNKITRVFQSYDDMKQEKEIDTID